MAVDLRDYQRQRVYDAEDVALGYLGPLVRDFTDSNDLIKWLANVLNRKRVHKKFDDVLVSWGDIEARICQRRVWSEAFGPFDFVLAHQSANEFVALHELAHVFQYRRYRKTNVAGHGPEFCGMMLDLVRAVKGLEWYETLKECYDEFGVDYN